MGRTLTAALCAFLLASPQAGATTAVMDNGDCRISIDESDTLKLVQAHAELENMLHDGFIHLRETLLQSNLGTESSLPGVPTTVEDANKFVSNNVANLGGVIVIPEALLKEKPAEFKYSGIYAVEEYDYLPTPPNQVDGTLAINGLNTVYRLTEAASTWTPMQHVALTKAFKEALGEKSSSVRKTQLSVIVPGLNICLSKAKAGYHYEISETSAVRVDNTVPGVRGILRNVWRNLTWFLGSS